MLNFKINIPDLSNTSNLFVKIKTEIRYRDFRTGLAYGFREIYPINANLITKNSTSNEITLKVEEISSLVTNEAKYTSFNASSSAIENYELKDVKIGITESDSTFAVTGVNNSPIVVGWQRANQSTSNTITDLLVKEFLDLQKSPLQILQGSIQSANISPLDIVKYKLNSDDVDSKYYMFLGGTFKANSEIMEGEWFRIKGD